MVEEQCTIYQPPFVNMHYVNWTVGSNYNDWIITPLLLQDFFSQA